MNAMKRNHTTEQLPKGPYAQALKMVGLTHAKRIVVDVALRRYVMWRDLVDVRV